jgi:predicted nuclease with RNAse H fold
MFLGLDLTMPASQTRPVPKPTAYALIDEEQTLIKTGTVRKDSEILELAASLRPDVIAIDAPLGLPRGLCCLELACPCEPKDGLVGRGCSRALSRQGISLYYTTKKSIIKPMVYRGMRLKSWLERDGFEVIEVYPYASKVRLFGKGLIRKSSKCGRCQLQNHLRDRVSGISGCSDCGSALLSHDALDAIVAAYTGYLYSRGETEALGWPDEGQIHIPRSA